MQFWCIATNARVSLELAHGKPIITIIWTIPEHKQTKNEKALKIQVKRTSCTLAHFAKTLTNHLNQCANDMIRTKQYIEYNEKFPRNKRPTKKERVSEVKFITERRHAYRQRMTKNLVRPDTQKRVVADDKIENADSNENADATRIL